MVGRHMDLTSLRGPPSIYLYKFQFPNYLKFKFPCVPVIYYNAFFFNRRVNGDNKCGQSSQHVDNDEPFSETLSGPLDNLGISNVLLEDSSLFPLTKFPQIKRSSIFISIAYSSVLFDL